uniref:Uncharacterized protein n=1 Tax=Ascaris lumbricoides TaxID=6252 RepID=A0A0M3HVB3_ASCLU
MFECFFHIVVVLFRFLRHGVKMLLIWVFHSLRCFRLNY